MKIDHYIVDSIALNFYASFVLIAHLKEVTAPTFKISL